MDYQQIIDLVFNEFKENQFLTGIIGGGIAGAAMFLLRAVPSSILRFIEKYFLYSIRINSENREIFSSTNEWINKNLKFTFIRNYDVVMEKDNSSSGRTRRSEYPLPLFEDSTQEESTGKVIKTPSLGWNFSFYKKIPVFINKTEESQNTKGVIQNIRFVTFLFFKGIINKILKEIEETNIKINESDKKIIYRWDVLELYWKSEFFTNEKTFDDIILNGETKQSILDDIGSFLSKRAFYFKNKIKYKRGYLFYGPPGTGKTTLITAISQHINWPVYFFNLSKMDESQFLDAFSRINPNAIIAFEEIDCVSSFEDRGEKTKKQNETGISLSTMLNCLDGLMSKMDVIFVATTNYKERLDEALIRSGRFDCIKEISFHGKESATNFVKHYLPDISENDLTLFINALEFPIAPSKLQDLVVKEHEKEFKKIPN